jgi:hypothetical protein
VDAIFAREEQEEEKEEEEEDLRHSREQGPGTAAEDATAMQCAKRKTSLGS